jgi:uncharacterized membrane protein
MRVIAIVVLCFLPFLMGHGGCGDDGVQFGPPTGAECPDESTLTYGNFGEEFMSNYCVRCHSAEVSGADREGAPGDHNFDSAFEIRAFADHIDQKAGSGPDATNDLMPPDGAAPSMVEREQLAEWLACGAPE